jgi:hypothetical protein
VGGDRRGSLELSVLDRGGGFLSLPLVLLVLDEAEGPDERQVPDVLGGVEGYGEGSALPRGPDIRTKFIADSSPLVSLHPAGGRE